MQNRVESWVEAALRSNLPRRRIYQTVKCKIYSENHKNLFSFMTSESQTEKDKSQAKNDSEADNEKILCPHCKRTATNGIKCKGICVADDDY